MHPKQLKKELIKLLNQWQNGEIDEVEMHPSCEYFTDKYFTYMPHFDSIDDDKYAYIFLTLERLDMLNTDLIIKPDIPYLLDLLNSTEKTRQQAWQQWQAHYNKDWHLREQYIIDNQLDYYSPPMDVKHFPNSPFYHDQS